jgi:hypothetical protein
MADRVVKILTPATTYDLLTLQELKVIFGILSTDTSQDVFYQTFITQYSDIIATTCNRVFGYEQVSEIWRCVNHDDTNSMTRIFLSHYPLDDSISITVESPAGTTIDPSTYLIEKNSGKIELLQAYSEPIKVTYWGGYALPASAPPALKQATALMVREGQALMQRLAVSGIRSISHKDSRVMYFDARQQIASVPGGAAIVNSVTNNLLTHYIRYEV